MVAKELRNVLSVLISLALLTGSSTIVSGFQNEQASKETEAPTHAAPMSENEIKGLVAPIALYPDNLVAMVLAAATSDCDCRLLGAAAQ